MNKQYKYGVLGMLIGVMSLTACTGADEDTDGIDTSEPIEFTTQCTGTRADNGELTNMPSGSKFAISMYYDKRVTSSLSDLQFTAHDASDMTVGDDGKCTYSSDDKKFYWTNRKFHGFIAYADNSALTTLPTVTDAMTTDLSTTPQSDPMLAVIKKQPAGGDNEANRVTLTFQHQVAQVEVNIKADGVTVSSSDNIEIKGITITGVSKKATVYTTFSVDPADTTHAATTASETTMDYTMNLDATPSTGYLASAKCLAFGKINSIKVDWNEVSDDKQIKTPHTAVYTFRESTNTSAYTEIIPILKSGKKYIYNLAVRRGQIAVVNTSIIDWSTVDTIYSQSGTITDLK